MNNCELILKIFNITVSRGARLSSMIHFVSAMISCFTRQTATSLSAAMSHNRQRSVSNGSSNSIGEFSLASSLSAVGSFLNEYFGTS